MYVEVVDTEDPTITAPSDVTQDADAGSCAALLANVTLGSPTTSDNCSIASTTNDAPASFPLGATTVTWTVTDASGNTATATQTVTIEDNEDPTITAPANVTVNADAGTCGAALANVTLGNATTSDNCSVASTTNDAPDPFPLGATTVTWTVTDGSGNTATATQVVTVEDNEDPTITAPADVTVNVDAGTCEAALANVTLGNATTADNCSVASTSNDAPTSFPVGATTVTWTVTDGSGNTATATQTVTVQDNEAPVLTVSDVTLTLDASGAATLTAGSATDNCTSSPTITYSQSAFACADLASSPISVTVTATDASGNTDQAVINVTLQDTEDPVLTVSDVTLSLDANGVATLTSGSATDNCSATISYSKSSFNCNDLGANTVVVTAADPSGNTVSETITVTIEDNIDPTVTGATVNVYLDANGEGSISDVTTLFATASDNTNCTLTYAASRTAFDCDD